ncbi:MAG TPA: hypothetical protein VFE51_11925 [Verrucomicrobiae bacterium]|nr:hypothetical protein [Verrucomicrobiae bacterium]
MKFSPRPVNGCLPHLAEHSCAATLLHRVLPPIAAVVALGVASPAFAVTNYFFNPSQAATVVVSNIYAVTVQSGDYRFTCSADGYWSSGGGTPTGRFFSILWPTGVQAQAITAGPLLGNGANITLQRADGKLFDLQAFTGKILLNTAGAGGAFEIMPQLNGNDAFNNPLTYDCTGYAGASFPYTTALSGYDTYQIHMWGDFALTALTLIDTNPPVPPAPNFTIATSVSPVDAGTAGGGGSYPSNSPCAVAASANPGWGFNNWTENGAQVSASANYTFTVRTNRTLVANFVPAFTVTATISPAYGGSASGVGTFNSNSTVRVTATPLTGFAFVNWSEFGTPVSISANYSFNLTANRTLVANFAPAGVGATFDFDSGTPSLRPGQGLPGTQTKNGVTATFDTLTGGWSVQNTFFYWVPTVFSGNFLYPSTWGSTMAVEFSQPVTNFTMSFFTGEVSSEYNTAGLVQVTAYTNSAMTNPIATGSARGAWISGAYPEGVLWFGSAAPFTKVRIEVPSQSPAPSYVLFVDNIVVQVAAPLPPHAPPLAFGGSFFQLAGKPLAINIADLTWSDYDPDGEPIFFVGASATTSNGLALTVQGTQILVPTNSVPDSFSYTIADNRGITTNGIATISIIAQPTSRVNALDLTVPGSVTASFTGVPWYFYSAQRATNATFTGTVQTWPVQAWADGSIHVRDNFADLTNQPPQVFYRLSYP